PKATRSRLITAAKTGRVTETSESFICVSPLANGRVFVDQPAYGAARLLLFHDIDGLSVAEPHRAVGDDEVAFLKTAQYFDFARPPGADPHLAADGDIVLDKKDEIRLADGNERFLGNDDGIARVLQKLHRHEQARFQGMIRIVDKRARGDRSRNTVDL